MLCFNAFQNTGNHDPLVSRTTKLLNPTNLSEVPDSADVKKLNRIVLSKGYIKKTE
jgi:hypothetical protein